MISRTFPETEFFLAPTTVRSRPTWFTPAQPSISVMIQEQVHHQQARVFPLPGFMLNPSSLDPDGIHFLPATGTAYCVQLIDSARYAIYIDNYSLL